MRIESRSKLGSGRPIDIVFTRLFLLKSNRKTTQITLFEQIVLATIEINSCNTIDVCRYLQKKSQPINESAHFKIYNCQSSKSPSL